MMFRVGSHKENSVRHFAQGKESFFKVFERISFPKMPTAWIKRDWLFNTAGLHTFHLAGSRLRKSSIDVTEENYETGMMTQRVVKRHGGLGNCSQAPWPESNQKILPANSLVVQGLDLELSLPGLMFNPWLGQKKKKKKGKKKGIHPTFRVRGLTTLSQRNFRIAIH